MTKQEYAQYWAEKDAAYLARYDKLAEALTVFADSEDYDKEVTRLLEDLVGVCEEKSAHTKSWAAWHKAMSFVHANDRA